MDRPNAPRADVFSLCAGRDDRLACGPMRIQMGQRSRMGATGIGGKLFLTVFCGIFAAVGIGLLIFLGGMAWRTVAVYAWQETACTIVASTMNTADDAASARGWEVRYRYTFAGREHESAQVSRGGFNRDFSTDLRLSQHYVAGDQATCFVDPDDPGQAVLVRLHPGNAVWVLFPLPFMAIGMGGLISAWRPRRPAADTGATPAVTAGARATSGSAGAWFACLFFGAFLGVGLLLTWMLGMKPLLRVLAARDWSEVPCDIVTSGLVEHDSDDGSTYSVRIIFRYEVDGRTYTADRYKFMGGSSSGRADKSAVVQRYPGGSTAVCYVNPEDPTEAVIERGFTGDMAFGFIPLVFALVGAGGLIGFVVKRANRVREPAFPRGALSNQDTGASLGAIGGPAILEARASRGGKFIGLTIFALVWNGIVSVFLVNLIGDWARTGPDWFLTIFLIPFVLVGLGVIGGAVHAGLAMFNPRPRLRVSAAALPPGATLNLEWEMVGNSRRLQRFHVFLEGREEATYRRGTNTQTDKVVFATIDIADVHDTMTIAAGRGQLSIPAGAMHSWESKHNKIVWALRVRGEIPRWPDIDDEFGFTILAEAPLPAVVS